MLAKVLLIGLNAFLIFWALEAVYVLWQAHRNDALPRFGRSRGCSGNFIIRRNILKGAIKTSPKLQSR
jgi:hypothetical protein